MNEKKRMELLAPAGSFDILKAVIEAGADAVYVGGPAFGARAYAGNFTQEELLEALDWAHLRGVKIYLTVNTLLKNSEIEQVADFLMPYYRRGLDAVLVQDLGACALIRRQFPDLEIHTSTQMTITAADGVRLMEEYGVSRVVMAREVSLAEMKEIHDRTGMELEAFVHGALCYCYSGQCLFSSILGGRSGNRGRCAQPCRLPYTVSRKKGGTAVKDSYVLSLKDLCGIGDLKALYDAGVYSLKIEGRMKSAAYAAGVVSIYRKYLDQLLETGEKAAVSETDRQHLSDLGSRLGFTDRYYDQHNGKDMVTFDKPNLEYRNEKFHEEITDTYCRNPRKLPAEASLTLRQGEASSFTVSRGSVRVSVSGMAPSRAQKKPLAASEVRARMEKTGDTPFTLAKLDLDMEEGIFLPNGALNALRRDGMEALERELLAPFLRELSPSEEVGEKNTFLPEEREDQGGDAANKGPEVMIAGVETEEQLQAVLKHKEITDVYIDFRLLTPLSSSGKLLPEKIAETVATAGKHWYISLPAICRQEFCGRLQENASALDGADGFVVKNYESLYLVRKAFPGRKIICDHNLYTYNDYASEAFRRLGAYRVTMPLELNAGEIKGRQNAGTEIILYGYYPLMVTAGCVKRNTVRCDRQPEILKLTDRYRTVFTVRNDCETCTNTIYNSLPTCLMAYYQRFLKDGIRAFRFQFTLENREETEKVLGLISRMKSKKLSEADLKGLGPVTGGHYKRGVE